MKVLRDVASSQNPTPAENPSERSAGPGWQGRKLAARTKAGVATLMLLGMGLAGCGPAGTPGDGTDGGLSPSGSPTASAPTEPTEEPTPQQLSWGPLVTEAERAASIVAKMTVAEQAGQVLMAHLPGTTTLSAEVVSSTHLGGLILMGDNISTVEQTKRLTKDFDAASRQASGQDVPALIGIDQEGGLVQRYIADDTPFPTAMAYGAIYAYDEDEALALAREGYQRIGDQIRELGVTIDFAPDADVTAGAQDPVIGARSFSGDPQAAAELTVAASKGLMDAGLLPVIKHFPGHGSVDTDSHQQLPVISKSADELADTDWVPFRKAIDDGVAAVMTGHLATADAPTVPATVKPENYRSLKKDLGFEGLNVTDAMNMGAIINNYGTGPATVAALDAGADLVLMPADVGVAHAAIVAAVDSGQLGKKRLREAATQVVRAKLYQQRLAEERSAAEPGSDRAFIQSVFAKAITDVSGSCGQQPLADGSSTIIGADQQQQQFLRTALATASEGAAQPGSGVALVGVDQLSVDAATTVTLNSPWPLAASNAAHKYALYGKGPAAMAALADVLSGKKTAPGRLPVAVGDYPAGTGCSD